MLVFAYCRLCVGVLVYACKLAHAYWNMHKCWCMLIYWRLRKYLWRHVLFFCTCMFILVNAWTFFGVWVGAFLLVHAYVLVIALVLVLKCCLMVVGIRLLAYRCMTVSAYASRFVNVCHYMSVGTHILACIMVCMNMRRFNLICWCIHIVAYICASDLCLWMHIRTF